MTLGLKNKKAQSRDSLYHHRLTSFALETEPLTESGSEPEMVVKQEPQDEDQAKPSPRAPKTLSSFFSEFRLLS